MSLIYSFKVQLITSSLCFMITDFLFIRFFNQKQVNVKKYLFGYFIVQYGDTDTFNIFVSSVLDTLIYIPCAIGIKTIYDKWN